MIIFIYSTSIYIYINTNIYIYISRSIKYIIYEYSNLPIIKYGLATVPPFGPERDRKLHTTGTIDLGFPVPSEQSNVAFWENHLQMDWLR